MKRTRRWGLLASLATLSLLTTGCLQGGGGNEEVGETEEGDGKVSILGAFPDPEAGYFEESLKQFEKQSGIDVTYTPSTDFTTEIRTRVQGGNPPDIALFPQPGLVLSLGQSGDALPLNDFMDVGAAEETLIPGFLDSVTDGEGNIYAVPMRMAVKSLVWYPKQEFEDAGYQVPETWTEMQELEDQIKSDGGTPWCIGAEAGADTGWVLTDWVEDMVLRTAGPDVYDQWYQHEIPFDDPAIEEAAGKFGEEILFEDGTVVGGPQGVLTTPFDVSPNGMFDSPPSCYLHRQGNFVTAFFPEDVQQNLADRVGLFVLPPVEDGYEGTPILGAGDMAAAFKNDADVKEVMEFIGSEDFGAEWAEAGGWLSPHATFDNSQYSDDITREVASLAQEADVFRFDASDLMPPEVGAGTFWDNMVAWTAGEKDLKQALSDIEESWPSS
jgi:alpha-glucoside transport system substrate-binding protein